MQLDAEYKEKLEAELEKMRALDERGRKLKMACKHIIDKILTLLCPNGHAFVDFDGCFALKCSICPCHFCGWCLADCGGDAHAHVRTCRHKPAGANDPYFGTQAQFEEAHREQQRIKVRSYLNEQVDASLKRDVVEACRKELQRNRLWPIVCCAGAVRANFNWSDQQGATCGVPRLGLLLQPTTIRAAHASLVL